MTAAPDEFRTDRLLARRISIADLPAMAAMNADPLVMKSLGGVLGADGSRAWVEEKVTHWREHEFGVYVLTSADGVVVGRAGLQYADVDDERCIELLYALRIEAWGNGYATEASRALLDTAFNVLGLPEVVAVTLPVNDRSRRVIERLGFAYQGMARHEDEQHRFYRFDAADWEARAQRWRESGAGVHWPS